MAVTKQGRGALPIIWLTNTLEFSNWIADRMLQVRGIRSFSTTGLEKDLPHMVSPKTLMGATFLVQVFEKDDDRPIFVQAWGGTITFVQALHRFRQKTWRRKISGSFFQNFICTEFFPGHHL
jgi:hypothetical protein